MSTKQQSYYFTHRKCRRQQNADAGLIFFNGRLFNMKAILKDYSAYHRKTY